VAGKQQTLSKRELWAREPLASGISQMRVGVVVFTSTPMSAGKTNPNVK